MRKAVIALVWLLSQFSSPMSVQASSWNTHEVKIDLPCARSLPDFAFDLSNGNRPENAFLALWAANVTEGRDARKIRESFASWGFSNVRFLGKASEGTNALLAETDEHYLLVFRGTKSHAESIADIVFVTAPYEGIGLRGWGHAGFSFQLAYLWKDLKRYLKDIDPKKPWVVSGHSMGGALALMAAVRLVREGFELNSVYTSGQPRVGDATFYEDAFQLVGSRYYAMENPMDYAIRIPTSAAAAESFARVAFREGTLAHKSIVGLVKAMNYAVPSEGMKFVLGEKLDFAVGSSEVDDNKYWEQLREDASGIKSIDDFIDMTKVQESRHKSEGYICDFLEAYGS